MFVLSCKYRMFYRTLVFMGTHVTSWIKNLLRHVLKVIKVITILKYLVHIIPVRTAVPPLERSTGTRAMYNIHVHIDTARIYLQFFRLEIIYFPPLCKKIYFISFCLIYTSFFRQRCFAASYHKEFSSLSNQITRNRDLRRCFRAKYMTCQSHKNKLNRVSQSINSVYRL